LVIVLVLPEPLLGPRGAGISSPADDQNIAGVDLAVNIEYAKIMNETKEKRGRGRPAVGPQIALRLPQQVLDAIASSLDAGEDRAGFIRLAIERELERRRSDES
jgi:hypothetical protein